jgi:polysaccharide biosynthesis/export protein
MLRPIATAFVIAGLLAGACAPRHHEYAAEFMTEHAHRGVYILSTGDRLRVIVFGQDNLSNVYAVDAQGRISMPLIGAVDAQGRTTHQLERQIESRLRAGFLREPKVSVEVDAYRPFFILGEVATSGQYPYVNGMTVQTAVAIAGGFSPRADRHVAVITRQVNGEIVTGKVPLTQPVLPGDTITVRERWF